MTTELRREEDVIDAAKEAKCADQFAPMMALLCTDEFRICRRVAVVRRDLLTLDGSAPVTGDRSRGPEACYGLGHDAIGLALKQWDDARETFEGTRSGNAFVRATAYVLLGVSGLLMVLMALSGFWAFPSVLTAVVLGAYGAFALLLVYLPTGTMQTMVVSMTPTTLASLLRFSNKDMTPAKAEALQRKLRRARQILTDHPKRYRAMLVEAANPAHSLADSPRMREALAALDTLVVIDVAMTETARLAHYVLPAATQFEKAEATFFNFDFPHNVFHLRARLLAPPDGPLPEAEIHAWLCAALGVLTEDDLAPLRAAGAGGDRLAYAQAFMARVVANPKLSGLAPVILYRTLPIADELREGAVVFGLALKAALEHPRSLARAGFTGPPLAAAEALFAAVLRGPSGVVFAVDEWADVLATIATPDRKLHPALPDLLEALAALVTGDGPALDPAFPFVLSAGERRSFTANTIIRDPSWRKKDGHGALRISPADAAALGVASGDQLKLTTRRASRLVVVEVTDSMQAGHLALPNGAGTAYPGADGTLGGIAPNELTRSEDRDPYVGTPWHKHVPARLDRVDATA